MTRDEIMSALESWTIALKAQHLSPKTVRSYREGIIQYASWCAANGRSPELTREAVNAWTASLLEDGREATTVRARQIAPRLLSAWLAEEGDIPRDELLGLKAVRLDVKVVDSLTDAALAALLKACEGKTFCDRRDEAIVRFMVESTARSDEVIGMRTTDISLAEGMAVVRRGKGGKGRTVPFGPKTGAAIDRYIRLHRRRHRLAATPPLWLGDRGTTFSYDGLYRTLKARARAAGIARFHPHQLRHTAATRWLDAGGSEGGLMAIAGWSRREMLDRYVRSTSERRAAEEARRLGLGDRL